MANFRTAYRKQCREASGRPTLELRAQDDPERLSAIDSLLSEPETPVFLPESCSRSSAVIRIPQSLLGRLRRIAFLEGRPATYLAQLGIDQILAAKEDIYRTHARAYRQRKELLEAQWRTEKAKLDEALEMQASELRRTAEASGS